jgi:spore coat protein U-like protein
MKRLLLALLALLVYSYAVPTLASGSASASLQVSVVVDQSCVISTTPLTFMTYSPFTSTPNDSTGTVTLHCSVGTVATIGLDCGTACTAGVPYMRNGTGGSLSYAVYQDTTRTTPWGNTTGTRLTTPAAPDTNSQVYNVYGRVPASQPVPPGSYTDTVTATVNF